MELLKAEASVSLCKMNNEALRVLSDFDVQELTSSSMTITVREILQTVWTIDEGGLSFDKFEACSKDPVVNMLVTDNCEMKEVENASPEEMKQVLVDLSSGFLADVLELAQTEGAEEYETLSG